MNKLTIIGNLTKDPELRTTTSGKSVCDFTVAVNRRQRDKDGNIIADFFRVSAWNERGETCAKYLQKGKKVCVVGAVGVHTYTTQKGETRADLTVLADEVEFLSPRQEQMEAAPAQPVDKQTGMEVVNTADLPF